MKNWLLAEHGIAGTGHADDAALVRHAGKFLLEVRIFRAAGAVTVLAVAGLRHEAVDDAVERHVVVKVLAREQLQPLGVMRRNVVAQLDDEFGLPWCRGSACFADRDRRESGWAEAGAVLMMANSTARMRSMSSPGKREFTV